MTSFQLAALAALAVPALLSAQLRGENIVHFRAADIEVTVKFRDDRQRLLERQLRPALTGALERYSELFGGPPRGSDGLPLHSLTVHVGTDPLGGGETDPGVLHLLVGRQPIFGFYDWRLTLLHEAFHQWSAETFRYAGPAEQWFNEGAAEFYAMQTAARLGLIDDVTAIRNAATAVGFYTSAFDHDRLSLTAAGEQKGRHYFLVYHGGWTAALVLDRAIRGRTGNTKSLDDVARWMYANFDRSARLYSTMDVARGVRESTGQDFSDFFARHVMGRLPLPVSATLNLGELARSLQAHRAGVSDGPAPDSLLIHSLGLARPNR